MAGIRMVRLLTVPNGFQARVIAARLGASGIPASVVGNVDAPYPFGDVFIDVLEHDFNVARQLLLADEVEAVFAPPPEAGIDGDPRGHSRRPYAAAWVVGGGAVVAELVTIALKLR